MMGRQTGDQGQLFYLFSLEERVPASHLLRGINPVVTQVLLLPGGSSATSARQDGAVRLTCSVHPSLSQGQRTGGLWFAVYSAQGQSPGLFFQPTAGTLSKMKSPGCC